jgi:hypothetical protein
MNEEFFSAWFPLKKITRELLTVRLLLLKAFLVFHADVHGMRADIKYFSNEHSIYAT